MMPYELPLAFAQGASMAEYIRAFAPVLFIFAIFYLLLIAPMRKRQKALSAMIAGLKKGDRVVTTGGLYGEVVGLEEKSVRLKIDDKTRVRVARSAIGGMQEDAAEETSS